MNNEIRKSLELRQQNLINLLKDMREHLDLEKQHQLYGAIKEIDYILKMLIVSDEEEVQIMKAMGSEVDIEVVKVHESSRKFKMPFTLKFDKDEL